ncbi:hypothetical protein POM88_025078 [Heracleum sosnowskyi]|uniref:Uncharacterized protein n=1 Tax=Heracleum sosnowskyi TaxID=360622 RepID=A0AAD8MMV5_9APIA|nr:hypothetical protein POM88_025078 [Heracleum sosnowskyi]
MELALSLEKLTNEKLLHLHEIAVHLDCYRSVKDSGGPWCCELCEDLSSSRSFAAMAVNSWEKPYFLAECGLCGGTGGAFRKTTDGQCIHAFCAEWVLESTFKRGQANAVQGMFLHILHFAGFGCDNEAVIKILAHRDAMQRALIQQEYNTMYSTNLLKKLASELRGKLEVSNTKRVMFYG